MAKINTSGSVRMTTRPRLKIITVCVGAALAQWGAVPAFADSAIGVDTALGNALNPPGRSAVPRPLADEGYDTVRRSPSGQMYGMPYDRSDEGENRTEGGWQYSGGVEAGVIGGDGGQKNAKFREYKDVKNGATLNYFEVEADHPDTAKYLQVFGGGAGQRDQFYGFQMGRYNDWKVKVFYNETVHVFTDTWKSIFNGEGTGNLTTGLPTATAVTAGSYTQGSANYLGPTGTVTCTPAAPCWSYNGKIYGNAVALAAINGFGGTPNSTTGLITAGTPQSNMAKAIADKAAATPNSELSLVRQKGGVSGDLKFDDFWKGYVSYTNEHRTGARPFAMNEGNISTEIAEPIDYTTHEMLGGLQYADSLTQANLRAAVSMFRNNISTMNVQYPLLSAATGNGVMQTATYDLYPNNDAFNLKGEFARNFPDFYKSRINATVSWGTNRQNDTLLAPISEAQNAQLAGAGITTLTGNNIGYAAGTALVSNWNTTQALSQQSANQRIDNKLLDLGISARPTEDLSLKGQYRYYETDNKGGYVAYNPLTGQFGRGFADGNGLTNLDTVVGRVPGMATNAPGSCYVPSGYATNALINSCKFWLGTAGTTLANGANVPVFGQARSTKQSNLIFSADYDLSRTSSINTAVEREEVNRDFRERAKTWEDKLKIGYVNRALGDMTFRTSLETDRKRGSEYRYRTFEDLGTGLPGLDMATQIALAGLTTGSNAGYPAVAAGLFNRYSYYFRKYDQANRDQNILNARVNYQAREDLDMGLMLQAKGVKYPDSFYGMERDDLNSVTLDVNYQPSAGYNIYAFYSFQQGKKSMAMNSGVAAATATCTAANLALYGYSACSDNVNGLNGARPLSDLWHSTSDEINSVFGLGFQTDIGRMKLALDYTYSDSRTRITYDYGSTAFSATALTQANIAAIAGSALPNMTYSQQNLNLSLLIPIDKKLAIRLFDRYETGKIRDWHYDSVITGAVLNIDSGTLLLDAGPQNYHNNIFGILIQYKL
jgi:hypothetical protein